MSHECEKEFKICLAEVILNPLGAMAICNISKDCQDQFDKDGWFDQKEGRSAPSRIMERHTRGLVLPDGEAQHRSGCIGILVTVIVVYSLPASIEDGDGRGKWLANNGDS